MIRVLVVDDSAFMRNMITKFLTSNHEIAVAGTARNGEEALQNQGAPPGCDHIGY